MGNDLPAARRGIGQDFADLVDAGTFCIPLIQTAVFSAGAFKKSLGVKLVATTVVASRGRAETFPR